MVAMYFLLALVATGYAREATESEVRSFLMQYYEAADAPPDGPTEISVNVYVREMDFEPGLGRPEDELTVTALVRQKWIDARLNYETLLSDEIDKVPDELRVKDASKVWIPDTFLVYDAFNSPIRFSNDIDYLITISSDGTVEATIQIEHTVHCNVEGAKNYPFDARDCDFRLASFSSDASELVYVWDTDDSIMVREPKGNKMMAGPFVFTDSSQDRECTAFARGGSYSCLDATLKFVRAANHQNMFVFCCEPAVIVCLSWLALLARNWQVTGPLLMSIVFGLYCITCAIIYSSFPLVSGSVIESYFYGGLFILFMELVLLVLMSSFDNIYKSRPVEHVDEEVEMTGMALIRREILYREGRNKKCVAGRLLIFFIGILSFAGWQVVTWSFLAIY